MALVYSDGVDALNLYEQSGALDPAAVEEFDRRVLAQRHVWVRDGRPRVVTWDADGVVYTVVTELGDDRLGQAIADLPRGPARPDPVERVGDGLTRMTTWSRRPRSAASADAASHTNPSGSTNGSASLLMAIRCDPVPSGETPAFFAAARPSVEGEPDR